MRKIKLNNCAAWIGNVTEENKRLNFAKAKGIAGIQLYGLYGVFGNASLEAKLALFIARAYGAPYNMLNVAAIMGSGTNGFQKALTFNHNHPANQQFNEFNKENEFWFGWRTDFTISTVSVGQDYTITLDNIAYTYKAVTGDTSGTIAAKLKSKLTAAGYNYSITGSVIKITRTGIVSRPAPQNSHSANISAELVNESFLDWSSSLKWLKAQIAGSNKIISAYVANPYNNWKEEEVKMMSEVLDIYEATNYTTTPNERSSQIRTNQLMHWGNLLSRYPKMTMKFMPIFSAEPNFMGTYLKNNGLDKSENLWNGQWNMDSFTGKKQLLQQGFVYFDYNNLSPLLP